MSRFKKLINIIYYLMSIIVLAVLLLMLNNENYFTQQILDMITSNENVMLVIKVLGAIVGVVALLKLLGTILQKTDEKYLYLFDDDGEVCVSNTAIEKTVKNALREFEEVIEYTVKIKIKNKEEKSKVSVKIKCGLDEEVCRGKGYYDYVNDNEKAGSMSLEETESEKDKKTLETDIEKSKKESGAEKVDKTAENVESVDKTAENAECTDKAEDETAKSDETEEKSSELEKTVEYRISDVNNETEKEENLAPEIIEAMSVISGDLSEEKSDESIDEVSEEHINAGTVLNSKDRNAGSIEDSKKTDEISKDGNKDSAAASEKENIVEGKKIASMSIDDLCSTIQVYTHDCLQEFLSQRVDRVDIKFYDVKVKEKIHNGPKQQKKQQKNTNKKINRKNKRVN